MISYFIYTIICMGLVLLFYHFFLAREKMCQINRWYLLIGLVFSLLVPFLPVGVTDSPLNFANNQQPSIVSEDTNISANKLAIDDSIGTSIETSETSITDLAWFYSHLLYLYGTVTLLLLGRLGWHLLSMRKKAMRNPASHFKGYKVVLLDEDVVPHTFGSTIYVSRKHFEEGNISKEMLLHELTHAREHHSLDIIFIELLKAVYWFNPVLYFYKRAIQMNHEFIADQNVLSQESDITSYQNTLLSLSKRKLAGTLSISLNFNVTKKRFKMMTASTSTYRYALKTALIVPFFAILGLTFGCEPSSMEKEPQPQQVQIEIRSGEKITLNGKTIPLTQFSSAFSELSIDPNKVIVKLNVGKNASMGAVTDVQSILRQQGALKINYSSDSSDDSEPDVKKAPSISDRNLLTIYVTKEGEILIDQEATPLSSVKDRVREFITNNGESEDLSETPMDAIVSFKTDQQTPYDTYIQTLESVLSVYRELRNQESMELFGKPYPELEEGSREKQQLEDLYPKRISIEKPAGT